MNGPDHYAEAQGWLLEVAPTRSGEELMAAVAIAQVHATLAVAAATIDAATNNVTHSGPEGYSATQADVANGVEWSRVQL